MRVVGGEWRGRPLAAPPGRATRPTSDKVREALFTVLGSLPAASAPPAEAGAAPPAGRLAGHRVLDLYAGSGALGIEALSRGAACCTFVERERGALRALRANLERVGATGERTLVVAGDVRRALAAGARRGAGYSLVLADPPYDAYAEAQSLLTDALPPLLTDGAVVVVETSARTEVRLPWPVVRERRYGDTKLTFLAAHGRGPEHKEPTTNAKPSTTHRRP